MPRHNWIEVRNAYTSRSDNPSLRDLAKEFHIHWTSVAKRSSKEGWADLRKEYQSKVGELVEKAQTTAHAQAVQHHLALIDKLVGVIDAKLSPTDIIKDDEGNITDVELKVEAKSYEGMLRMLCDLIKLRTSLAGVGNNGGLPSAIGAPGSYGENVPNLQTIINQVNIWTDRSQDMQHLLGAGKDLLSVVGLAQKETKEEVVGEVIEGEIVAGAPDEEPSLD